MQLSYALCQKILEIEILSSVRSWLAIQHEVLEKLWTLEWFPVVEDSHPFHLHTWQIFLHAELYPDLEPFVHSELSVGSFVRDSRISGESSKTMEFAIDVPGVISAFVAAERVGLKKSNEDNEASSKNR